MIHVSGIALGRHRDRARPASRRRYSRRERAPFARPVAAASGSRARRIAACISSSREFTPNSLVMVAIGLPAVAQPAHARARAASSPVVSAPPSPSAPRFLVG